MCYDSDDDLDINSSESRKGKFPRNVEKFEESEMGRRMNLYLDSLREDQKDIEDRKSQVGLYEIHLLASVLQLKPKRNVYGKKNGKG